MVAHLTMILLIYFLAAMAVHAMHQRHLSRPESEGFEQILLIPSQSGRADRRHCKRTLPGIVIPW